MVEKMFPLSWDGIVRKIIEYGDSGVIATDTNDEASRGGPSVVRQFQLLPL